MTTSRLSPVSRLVAAAARVAARMGETDVSVVLAGVDDELLLSVMADAAVARDAADLVLAAASAEVARRSARELGHVGLAQRRGHRSATSLVQNVTGQSRGDVGRALRAGEDLRTASGAADAGSDRADAGADRADPTRPAWRIMLRDALTSGEIGQAQFHAIRTGLGEPPIERYPTLDPAFLPECVGGSRPDAPRRGWTSSGRGAACGGAYRERPSRPRGCDAPLRGAVRGAIVPDVDR